MEPAAPRPRRARFALAVGAGVLLLGAGAFALLSSGPSYHRKGSVHCVTEKGFLYTFDAVWRVETLRRIDPATQVATATNDPERLARLRTVLLEELKVEALDKVPVEGDQERKAIEGLGYFGK